MEGGEKFLGLAAAFVVGGLQAVGTAFKTADFEVGVGADDEGAAGGGFGLGVLHLGVIVGGALLHGTAHGRMFPGEEGEEHVLQAGGLFPVAFGLGEDDDIAGVALLLEVAKRDGVADTAVEEGLAVKKDGAADAGHTGSGAYPLKGFVVDFVELLIYGETCLRVGTDEMESHRVAPEGFAVENIMGGGHDVVGETGVDDVAGGEE